ncbi:uncharacterized protein LOC124939305 [Impatiens glandulifera]|uniref:uncharacterized protein LOC124939305 n=1 Tax=Impatiens glandulifera TaxID=253017 RepID=UPI001FB0811A|nr:uncharacterized protein LOC124939305 [Impatiens glandulifera]
MIGKIVAWNVCGINDNAKRKMIKSLVGTLNCGIYYFSETKMQHMNQWIIRDLCNWRFCGWEALNSIGTSCGILVTWNEDLFEKVDINIGQFFVSIQFRNRGDNFRWVFSAVYGPVLSNLKSDFFNELVEVTNMWDLPIIFAGDMNEVRVSTEKKGARRLTRNMHEFSETIENLELVDLPLKEGNSHLEEKVLPWTCSYHRPILIEWREVVPTSRPFKFKNKWLTRDNFISKVEGWWAMEVVFGSPSSRLFIKLKNLRKMLKSWFVGDRALFRSKVEVLSREILLIDGAEEVRDLSSTEISTRILLVSELLELCKEEEIGARQRNRAIWLREGDKTLSISMESLKHKREITLLTRYPWLVSCMRTNQEPFRVRLKLNNISFTPINASEKCILEALFSIEEVETTIMDCGSDKSPGSDSFTIATGTIDVKNFRPISLVTSFYKIISKCLSNRMRGILGTVISGNQMAFIKDHQTFDAALIANDCIDLVNSKGDKCAFVKLDIEKAYDHVNWEFFFDIMGRMSMGKKWIRWIRFCLSTTKFFVIVNESSHGFFESSMGLRQGEPLSPFLFIIVMEGLSRMLSFAEDADHTLCMIQATERNVKHLRDILWINLVGSPKILIDPWVATFGVIFIPCGRDSSIKDMFDIQTSGFSNRIRYRRRLNSDESMINDRLLLMVRNKGLNPSSRDSIR